MAISSFLSTIDETNYDRVTISLQATNNNTTVGFDLTGVPVDYQLFDTSIPVQLSAPDVSSTIVEQEFNVCFNYAYGAAGETGGTGATGPVLPTNSFTVGLVYDGDDDTPESSEFYLTDSDNNPTTNGNVVANLILLKSSGLGTVLTSDYITDANYHQVRIHVVKQATRATTSMSSRVLLRHSPHRESAFLFKGFWR